MFELGFEGQVIFNWTKMARALPAKGAQNIKAQRYEKATQHWETSKNFCVTRIKSLHGEMAGSEGGEKLQRWWIHKAVREELRKQTVICLQIFTDTFFCFLRFSDEFKT